MVDGMVPMAARVNPTLPFQHGLTSQSSIKLKSHPAAAFIQIWPRCRGSASWTAEGPAVCPTRCNHRWGYGWGLQKKTSRISDRVGALDSWESWGKIWTYDKMIFFYWNTNMCPSSNQCIGLAHKNKNQGTSFILHHPILGLSKFALHVDLKKRFNIRNYKLEPSVYSSKNRYGIKPWSFHQNNLQLSPN